MSFFYYKEKCKHPTLNFQNGASLSGGRAIPAKLDLMVHLDANSVHHMECLIDTSGVLTRFERVQERTLFYPIEDRKIPTNVDMFKEVIEEVKTYIKNSKKIHIQCIGGHGRTGLTIAIILKEIMPSIDDPVEFVRKKYCKKAVESYEQHEFVNKWFGLPAPNKDKYIDKTQPFNYEEFMKRYSGFELGGIEDNDD